MLIRNPKAWAVILAGGDGTRLQSLTRVISGDARPKQFCPIFGERTLLAETRARLARLIPADRTLFVLQEAHRAFYQEELAEADRRLVLSQPANKGTAVAIAYAVVKVLAGARDPMLAFFPADHHYDPEKMFLDAVERAIRVAASNPRYLTLLGVEAYSPETEYGWIEPGFKIGFEMGRFNAGGFTEVRRFWEKPSLVRAQELLERGCLWNTFVMIGKARAFADMLRAAAPGLMESMERIVRQGNLSDPRARRIFSVLPEMDFSQTVLARQTARLLVVPVQGVRWSDLGKPERVIETLAEAGIRPRWAEEFARRREMGQASACAGA